MAIALVVAIGLAGAMDSLLFGVPSLDMRTLLAVGVTLFVAAPLACVAPARRAARTDPILALKQL